MSFRLSLWIFRHEWDRKKNLRWHYKARKSTSAEGWCGGWVKQVMHFNPGAWSLCPKLKTWYGSLLIPVSWLSYVMFQTDVKWAMYCKLRDISCADFNTNHPIHMQTHEITQQHTNIIIYWYIVPSVFYAVNYVKWTAVEISSNNYRATTSRYHQDIRNAWNRTGIAVVLSLPCIQSIHLWSSCCMH